MKTDEIRELTNDEIVARIENAQEEIFRLRFRSATQEIDNPMILRLRRREIARLKTILGERQAQGEGSRS